MFASVENAKKSRNFGLTLQSANQRLRLRAKRPKVDEIPSDSKAAAPFSCTLKCIFLPKKGCVKLALAARRSQGRDSRNLSEINIHPLVNVTNGGSGTARSRRRPFQTTNARGTTRDRVCAARPLTDTFIQVDIAQWPRLFLPHNTQVRADASPPGSLRYDGCFTFTPEVT